MAPSTDKIINQVMSLMIQDHPFPATATATAATLLTGDTISDILRSIPRYFFHSPRSIGSQQPTTRHRSPLKQRRPTDPSYRDPQRVRLGVKKAMEFFHWVEKDLNFTHTELTCKEMACVLAKSRMVIQLWEFVKEIYERKEDCTVISLKSVTCLIKVLSEEGLVNEALSLFYRMKKYHLKPDVCAYNVVIYALCGVGNFKKAKFLLEQMELPGFRCPPDSYTYTILISSYCKFSMQTGSKKAVRKRLYEANRLFRVMLFKGFVPDVVTYNCLIDGCCKLHRISRAEELFVDMERRGCVPNRVTYNSFIRYYSRVNEIDKAVEMLRRLQSSGHGFATSSCYTPIIHALCEAGRILEAKEFLVELVNGGSVPREYTYKLVCDGLESVGDGGLLDDEIRSRVADGIEDRFRVVKKVKAIMA